MATRQDSLFIPGGDIELIVLLGPCPVKRKYDALRAVWVWSHIQGPYTDIGRTLEPSEEFLSSTTLSGSPYGYARAPNGKQVEIVATLIGLEDEVSWLCVTVPLHSLRKAYAIGEWPNGRSATEPWALALYGWLYLLAEHIFEQVRFQRGIIGFEAFHSGYSWLFESQQPAPERRMDGYIVANDEGLEYLAPNSSDPLIWFG